MAIESISQSAVIRMQRPLVWRALQDPEILRQCISGCEQFDLDGERRYRIAVRFKLGPLSRLMKGSLMLTDPVQDLSFNFRRGGNTPYQGAGAFSGTVLLSDHQAGTQVDFKVQIEASAALLGMLNMFGLLRADGRIRDYMAKFEQAAIARYGQVACPFPGVTRYIEPCS